jgi:hypothetical protein
MRATPRRAPASSGTSQGLGGTTGAGCKAQQARCPERLDPNRKSSQLRRLRRRKQQKKRESEEDDTPPVRTPQPSDDLQGQHPKARVGVAVTAAQASELWAKTAVELQSAKRGAA